MTKTLVLAALVLSAVAPAARAETCKATVEQAAKERAETEGRRLRRSVDVAGSKLVSDSGEVRHYLVTVFEQYATDSESGSYPDEYYLVTAVGTQYACVVKNIKKK